MPTSSNYYIVYIGSSHFQKTLHAILTPVIMKLMIIKTDFEQKLKKENFKKRMTNISTCFVTMVHKKFENNASFNRVL